MKIVKNSLFTGAVVALALILFAFALLYTLFLSQEQGVITKLDPRVYELLKFTLFQAFLSTLLSVAIGLLLAWSLAHQQHFRGRSILIAIFSSSLVIPTLIVVFGLITILGRNGWVNSLSLYLFDYSFGTFLYGLFGILVAHIYLNASFASVSLLHIFESIPKEKYKLAKSLNFTIFQRFRYIELPAIKSSLLSISSTIFLLCFSSFAIVLVLGGTPKYNTLEVAIYEAVKLDFDIAMALRLALIQLTISTLFVILSSNFKIGLNNLKSSTLAITWSEPKSIKYFQMMVIFLFALFFTLPLVAIVFDGVGADFKKILSNELFQKSFITSMSLATISTVLTLLFALFLSDTRRNFNLKSRLKEYRFSKLLDIIVAFSGNIYLAIPSLIMGLGFFVMSQNFKAPMVSWSVVAVVTANVLISLPFALATIYPIMQKSAKRYDRLAFSLNLSIKERWLYCELPYLKSALGYIFALSFCLSLGDLGIIALFGSDEFSTLPWYLYQLMGSYRTADASGVALILLGTTLVAFTLLPRVFGGKHVKNN